jgi:hypothetical protein
MQSPNLSSTIPDCKIETSYETDVDADSTYVPPMGGWFTVSNPAAGAWRVRAILSGSADSALGSVEATLGGDEQPLRRAFISFILAPGESLQWRLKVMPLGRRDKLEFVRELGKGRDVSRSSAP